MGWRRVGVASPPVFTHPSSSLLHSTFTCYSVVMHLIFVFSEDAEGALMPEEARLFSGPLGGLAYGGSLH